MGNRLTKIFTKKGDDGTTDLGGNNRVEKFDSQIIVYGELDELGAAIGLITCQENIPSDILDFLQSAQQEMFNIAGELSAPEFQSLDDKKVVLIEDFIDRINESLPPLKEFVVPGEEIRSAQTHMARAICRRAERSMVKLSKEREVNSFALKYLNRLSDAFFVIARLLARESSAEEKLWKHERAKKE